MVSIIQTTSTTLENDSFLIRPEAAWLTNSSYSVGDLVEITNNGRTEVYEIEGTYSATTQTDEIEMGLGGRNRFYDTGTTAPNTFSASMAEYVGEYMGIRTADVSWPEVNDEFSLRADSGALSDLDASVGDRVDITDQNSGNSAIFRVMEQDSHDSSSPATVMMGGNARARLNVGARSSTASGFFESGDWDITIESASLDWEEVNDAFSIRVSQSLWRFGYEGDSFNEQDRMRLSDGGTGDYFGVYTDHTLDHAKPTIRMGGSARARIGDPATGTTLDSYSFVTEEDIPIYIEQAVAEWNDIGDEYGIRPPDTTENRQNWDESFITITSEETGASNEYGVGNFHTEDFTIETWRMSGPARSRINDPSTPSVITTREYHGRPQPRLHAGQSEWGEVGDEFAFRASTVLTQWWDMDEQEDRFNLTSFDTGEDNVFGYWQEHDEEVWWPTVRMGTNARARIGDPAIGSTLQIEQHDGLWSRFYVSLSSWDEEIGNALLCRVSQPLADEYGLEPGDYVEVTPHEDELPDKTLVYQVNDIHDFQPDRMRATIRTARWGRFRFVDDEMGITEADVEDMVVNVEPYTPEYDYEYIGVGQLKSEWDFPYTSERIVLRNELLDRFDLDPKFDSPPEVEGDRDYANMNIDTGWHNPRIFDADNPENSYAAYTCYAGTDADPNRRPRIYMGLLSREKLTLPDWFPEKPEVPNSFVVKPRKTLIESTITKPRFKHSNDTFSSRVYNEDEAGEFYRNDESSRLLTLAPHGGDLEWGCSAMANRTAQAVNCAYWIFEGRWEEGNSFERWHVTSSDMGKGFPAIRSLGFDWDYTFSYHGLSGDEALIGGNLDIDLRETYGFDYLQPAIPDVPVIVHGVNSEPRHDAFAAKSKDNITNRLTDDGSNNGEGGMQLELPSGPRQDRRWRKIADATASFYRQEIGDIQQG